MRAALTHGRVLTDRGAVEDRAVVVEDGRIAGLVRQSDVPAGYETHALNGHLLVPGFIDTQVNGGGGVLFGDAPSIESLRTISHAHAQFGTTAFLPTLISGTLDLIRAAIDAVDAAIEAKVPGIAGIHIEGPFLNPARRGIHDDANFRKLDAEALALLASAKHGKTMVTLAPEQTTPDMVQALVRSGVIVSCGHTDATYRETWAALEAGATGFTHLFNAMSPLKAREPGAVGAALDHTPSWAGIIVDGHHVDPATLRVALAAKKAARLMLVTDAMPSVGAAYKDFVLQGRHIAVQDGVCRGPDGTLAGSDLDMASALRNSMKFLGVDLNEASAMASRNPAAFLGLGDEMGSIRNGQRANFVLLDDALEVRGVWIDGHPQRRP
ncbi:MAG TPA: N-acetylglucosamine-6-phosphate deacetylase [Rhizomicrobium sp.]|jgi:N-acetylglucosamine-6-phosphate deacetylase|nr:N-acetylglucosamine-6-phosphate deacetylase [Rhizomicrobium sp.]